MSYTSPNEILLEVLRERIPAQVTALERNLRQVKNGLLPVGLKIHALGEGKEFIPLLQRLIEATGEAGKLGQNHYRHEKASFCLVLEPVGNAATAIQFIECLEDYLDTPIFNSKEMFVQVCSPGKLKPTYCALLAIGSYLGSDLVRTYEIADFATTFSKQGHATYPRARRMVIYDAGGEFDPRFSWWKGAPPHLHIDVILPFEDKGRSDVLMSYCQKSDITNINLLATLLVHHQYGGYWYDYGSTLVADMVSLLDQQMMLGILEAPWVRTDDKATHDDARFVLALQEIVTAANSEARNKEISGGLLAGMDKLIKKYRDEIEWRCSLLIRRKQE